MPVRDSETGTPGEMSWYRFSERTEFNAWMWQWSHTGMRITSVDSRLSSSARVPPWCSSRDSRWGPRSTASIWAPSTRSLRIGVLRGPAIRC